MASDPVFADVKPWPKSAEPASATIGHNSGAPSEADVQEQFRRTLLIEKPDFDKRLEQIEAAAERVVVSDDETLGRAGDMVRIIRATDKLVSDTHVRVKAPYLAAGRVCDAEKNALTGRLSAARTKVEGIANAFVAKREAERRAEEQRRQAEERAAAEKAAAAGRERERAEREAAEAAAKATNDEEREAAQQRAAEAAEAAEQAQREASLAAAAPADDRLVRSDAGATVGTKQDWQSQVTDYELAFMACSDNANVRIAIDKAIASLVRAGKREIDGVRIWPVAKGNFR
jgi:flagellar biosynthesis GTPase FlhF